MKGKKGAEMTIGTIVIIVLAIAVLVFLIFGFTTGWTNLWERIGIFGGGGENISDIAQACAVSCAQNDVYGFNQKVWKIEDADGFKAEATCNALSGEDVVLKKDNKDDRPLIKVVDECPNLF